MHKTVEDKVLEKVCRVGTPTADTQFEEENGMNHGLASLLRLAGSIWKQWSDCFPLWWQVTKHGSFFMKWHYTSSPGPKMFESKRLAQELMAIVFWEDEGVSLPYFLEHGHTKNRERYPRMANKYWEATRRKRPNQNLGVMTMHGHTHLWKQIRRVANWARQLSLHPLCASRIWGTDFCLLGPVKDSPQGQCFVDTDKMKMAMKKCVTLHTRVFIKRIAKLGSTMVQMHLLVIKSMLISAFPERRSCPNTMYNLNDAFRITKKGYSHFCTSFSTAIEVVC